VEGSELRTTLVNHSTVLLQQQGCNILTDPIWSERASPVVLGRSAAPQKAGSRLGDLPPLDAVLISHNHYDHLDLPTLRRLAARGGSAFVVPAGVGRLLRSENIGPVHEMDWGESRPLPGLHHPLRPGAAFLQPGNFTTATGPCGAGM
jgi:L-ascorbate metabolism protein UlaG (beta-lactamase superfamily)